MRKDEIFITRVDRDKLVFIIEKTFSRNHEDRFLLKKLEDELKRAHIVDPREIPPDVITMNSKVCIKDLDTGEEEEVVLVFPGRANFEEGKISVLAPVGMALLGYRVGDVIEWEMPRGIRRLKVKKVLYQPESCSEDLD
ncbi:MAG: nucleoside diphosphate kinase regulator [Elusimicrobia bacterium]|nr:nucleoside diphosphate kinase regulator [Elusimicrobiota bacterium]